MQSGNKTAQFSLALQLTLAFCLFFPADGLCQSSKSGIQIRFTDRPAHSKMITTANPNRVVLAGNWRSLQESDFEPKVNLPTEIDLQDDLQNGLHNVQSKSEANSLSQKNNDPTQSRDSDAPVEPPKFQIDEEMKPTKNDSASEDENAPKEQVPNDEYRLPMVASVYSPISLMPLANVRQSDPSGLLINDHSANRPSRLISHHSSYSEITGRSSQLKYKTWRAHDFYHRPLYFEDHNAERHGNRRPFERVTSTVHFFGSIPTLPYKIGERPPKSRVYTHGQVRPGDYTQFQVVRPPTSRRGEMLQTLVFLGIILP